MISGCGLRAAGGRTRLAAIVLSLVLGATAATSVLAQTPSIGPAPAIEALIEEAYDAAYSLDYESAIAIARRAVVVAPADSRTHRVLAAVVWMQIIFDRGAVTVDHYLGGITKSTLGSPKPAAEADAEFRRELARAIELAEQRLKAKPDDLDARFEAGAAYGLQASYAASIDGSMTSAFRSAKRAYDAQEAVLTRDPSRAKAGVVVGTYRYLVSSMAIPARMFAYLMGFGGGKEKGISLLEGATRQRDARVEARTALILIFSRERRYTDALRIARELEADYPRNRLFTLEMGSCAIRAGQFAEADAIFTRGLATFDKDPRRKVAGERALWLYKRGVARLRMNRLDDARVDLNTALGQTPSPWVRGRITMERGKISDLGGRRAEAVAAYKEARIVAVTVEDVLAVASLDQWLRRPYTLTGK